MFIYPAQGVAGINEPVVPAATPVRFSLTSSSVWNTFFVPRLGSMIYTMRGMVTPLDLMADRESDLHGTRAGIHHAGKCSGWGRDLDFFRPNGVSAAILPGRALKPTHRSCKMFPWHFRQCIDDKIRSFNGNIGCFLATVRSNSIFWNNSDIGAFY